MDLDCSGGQFLISFYSTGIWSSLLSQAVIIMYVSLRKQMAFTGRRRGYAIVFLTIKLNGHVK